MDEVSLRLLLYVFFRALRYFIWNTSENFNNISHAKGYNKY